jgi:hypothetical protein
MTPEHLVGIRLDQDFAAHGLTPGRVTMRLIRRVHWRIYPFRIPKILAALSLLGLLLWQVPATRDLARRGYARVRAEASAALGHGRPVLQGK